MTCHVCKSLSKKQLKSVASDYEGGSTPESLSAEYAVSYPDMITHCTNCLDTDDDDAESSPKKLKRLNKDLWEMLDVIKQSCLDNPKRSDIVQAYARLATEARELTHQLDLGYDPDEYVRKIIKSSLNPLVEKSVKSVTTLLTKIKGEMVNAGVDPKIAESVTRDMILEYGRDMKTAQSESVERLCKTLNINKKEINKLLASQRLEQYHPRKLNN